VDVESVAPEKPIRLDLDAQVQIPWRATRHAGLPLATQADSLAVLDAGRDPNLDSAATRDGAIATALPTRVLD
jgi:hypothetical protein